MTLTTISCRMLIFIVSLLCMIGNFTTLTTISRVHRKLILISRVILTFLTPNHNECFYLKWLKYRWNTSVVFLICIHPYLGTERVQLLMTSRNRCASRDRWHYDSRHVTYSTILIAVVAEAVPLFYLVYSVKIVFWLNWIVQQFP